MALICKKHGKPREVIVERKMPNGATFAVVGCADCAKPAMEQNGIKAKSEAKHEERTGNLRAI